jgi:BirA family biotin operon repressor/biotin-[acetyl-CoA-carboxylase] ligase
MIWKCIEDLRCHGYVIESRRRNGYRLVKQPDRVGPEEIGLYRKSKKLGKPIRYFPQLDSTQLIAHQWAKEEAPEGALVVADQQLKGKGRFDHQWVSPPGSGIWMSLILRPEIPLLHASQLNLLACVAVYEAILQLISVPLQIKWPNDLLMDGKKVCGILTELKGDQDCIHYLVLGIGLNVHHHAGLPAVATSLEAASRMRLMRAQVIAQLLNNLEQRYEEYLQYGFAPVKERWESGASQLFGREITARSMKGTIRGIVEGIDEQGALILRTADRREILYSAEIEC